MATIEPLGLPQLRSAGLAATAFQELCDRIVGGEIAPGTVLSERRLCAELGVSRTAVREAIARLEQLRLVAVRHGGQTRVLDYKKSAGLDLLRFALRPGRPSPPSFVRAGIEMRAAIAPDVARLAAERGSHRAGELEAIAARMGEALAEGDLLTLQELSLVFWSVVVEAADNIAYELAFNSLREALEPLRKAAGAALAQEFRHVAGYEAIARAVRAADGAAAEKAARAHIAIGLAALGLGRKKK